MNTFFSDMTVFRLTDICKVDLQNMPDGKKENRPHSVIYFKRQGRTVYTGNGASYISDKDHILFLPAGCSYSVHFDLPGICDRVEFDCDCTSSQILSIPVKNSNAIIALLDRLENLWLFKKPSYHAKSMAGVYELLSRLDDLSCATYAPNKKFRLIEPGIQYLEAHYNDPELRMEQIAAAAGITQTHFRRIFHEMYHSSPMDYVRNIRINRAKSLLSGDFSSVQEIALSVGFTDKCIFSKAFRRVVGVSPLEYARNSRA